MNYTASGREPEQRLAYFREDIGVNMHHYHWHMVYPGDGPQEIVNKDRRGELFYYMHSQVSCKPISSLEMWKSEIRPHIVFIYVRDERARFR